MFRRLQQTYLAVFHRYPFLIPLAVVTACGELVYAGINNFSLPLLLKDEYVGLGIGSLAAVGVVLGWVTSTFLLSETILRYPFGKLSDRWGRLAMMTMGPLVGAISPVLIANVSSYRLIYPLRVLDGFGAAALWPSLFALVGDRVSHAWRATAMSVTNMIYIAAVALGPYLAGQLMQRGTRLPFYAASGLLVLAAAVVVAWLRPVVHRAAAAEAAPAPAATELPHAHVRPTPGRRFLMLVITFGQSFAIIMLAPYMVLFASARLHLDPSSLGLLFIGPAILVGILAIPLGRLADRWSRPRAVQVALIMAALAMWLLPQTSRLLILVGFASLFGLAYTLGTPAWFAILADISHESERGSTFGSFSTAQGLGSVAAPVVGGHLWALGIHLPFYASAALLSACALLSFPALRGLGIVPPPPPAPSVEESGLGGTA